MKPLCSGHPRALPTVRLIDSVWFITISQWLLTINIQGFFCTSLKLQVVNEAVQSLSSSAFNANFNLFVMMPFPCFFLLILIGPMRILEAGMPYPYSNDNTGTFHRLFQGRNPKPHGQFSPVFAFYQ